MYQAAQVEDTTVHEVSEKVARLEYENKHLREVLQLSYPVVSSEENVINLHSCSNSEVTISEKEDISLKNSPRKNKWSQMPNWLFS